MYMIKRMLPREVAYARPGTIDEAVRLLGAARRGACPGRRPDARQRDESSVPPSPEVLVDLADLGELRAIALSADGSSLEIGAMLTYRELVRSPEIAAGRPILAEVAAHHRRRAGAEPRHDRRQRLRQRSDEPPAAAPDRARRDLHDPERRRRAHGRRRRVLRRRLLDRRRRGRAADAHHRAGSRSPATGDALEGVTLGVQRHLHRERRDAASRTAACASRSAASRRVPERATAVEETLARRRSSRPRPSRLPSQGLGADDRSALRRARERRLPPRAGRGVLRRDPCSPPPNERRDEPDERAERPHARSRSRSTARPTSARSRRGELLVHFIRDDLDLTGTHIGCDTGNCGACTVHVERPGRQELHDARGAGRRRVDPHTVEGLAADDGELTPLQQAFSDTARPAVRLLHAGHADERDRAARREPAPVRARDQGSDPGQHLPLHRLLEHHRGRARRGGGGVGHEHHRARTRPRSAASSARASRARRTAASCRARASSSTTSSATTWATCTSCAPPTRTRASSRSTSARRSRRPACIGTLTGDEVAILTEPFFQIAPAPGGNIKDYALAVGKARYLGEAVVAVVADDARARTRRRRAGRGRVRSCSSRSSTRGPRATRETPLIHEEIGSNESWNGVYEWGDVDAAFAEADHIVRINELHFDRFNSTPLETNAALVEYHRGTGQWTSTATTSSRASRRS